MGVSDLGIDRLGRRAAPLAKVDRALLIDLLADPQDGQAIADRLLAHWPTLAELLHAPSRSIRKIAGDDAADKFVLMRTVLMHVTRKAIEDRVLIGSSKELRGYFRARLAFKQTEELRVLFLNPSNRLISDEPFGYGTSDQIVFAPREIIRRALELRATALILAHNHPGGSAAPSPTDIQATAQLNRLAQSFDIKVHDHIIVTRGGCHSLQGWA